MKKLSFLLVIIFLMLIMSGCFTTKVHNDAIKFKKEYEDLNNVETKTKGVYHRSIKIDEDNPIIYTTFKEVKERLENKETFILYVGFSSCPWCRSVIPYILKEAKENNIDKIYYINLREDNQKESDLRGYYKLDENNNVVYDVYPDKYYHDVLNTLDEFLSPYTLITDDEKEIETKENRLYAPSLIAFKNGKAIALDACISDMQKDGYQKLSDEIIDDMKEKANSLFFQYKNCSLEKSCK